MLVLGLTQLQLLLELDDARPQRVELLLEGGGVLVLGLTQLQQLLELDDARPQRLELLLEGGRVLVLERGACSCSA